MRLLMLVAMTVACSPAIVAEPSAEPSPVIAEPAHGDAVNASEQAMTPEPSLPAVYSCLDIADAMQRAGFLDTSIGPGIVMAESHGRPGATHTSPVERSVGVWQINLLAHPSVSEVCARDLDCSTRAAFTISAGGTSWRPWTVYRTGSWMGRCGLAR